MDRPKYVCARCGAALAVGARWCPSCRHGADDAVFVGETPVVAPPLQRPYAGEYSRWKKGVTTFGPGVKVTLTVIYAAFLVWGALQMFVISYVAFALIGLFLMYHLWRKDQVDESKSPVRDSVKETTDSFRRDQRQRQSARAGAGEDAVVCTRCGAWKRVGERECYRCGNGNWCATSLEITEPVAICGACDSPWFGERPWCHKCRAPRSQVIWVQPHR